MRRDVGVVGVALSGPPSASPSLSAPLLPPLLRMRNRAPGVVLLNPGIRRPVAVLFSWLELGK